MMIKFYDMKKRFILKNRAETENFAHELAQKLKPGDVVALTGELGAGKTALTKFAARELGAAEDVTSPTFNIVKEYRSGRLPVYHFDVYRVNDPDELFEIGFEDYISGRGVCFIEWANLIEEMIPARAVWIDISFGKTETERIIDMEC